MRLRPAKSGVFYVALSLVLHFVVTAVVVMKRNTPEPAIPSEASVVYVYPGSPAGLARLSSSEKAARLRVPSRPRRVSPQKLFALSEQRVWSGPQAVEGASGTVTDGEGKAEAVSGDGRVLIEVMGEPRLLPLLNRLARLLHEGLSFTRELCDLHSTGAVETRMLVNPEGTFDGDTLQASSEDKYLLVYVIQRFDELFGRVPHRELAHHETVKPKVRVQVRFLSGPNVRFATNPLPRVSRENIEMERRRQTALNVESGPLNAGLRELHGALAGGLSLNLDLESLFSRSHRKAHGWSGTKNTEQRANALKFTYDRLWVHYKARGWIR